MHALILKTDWLQKIRFYTARLFLLIILSTALSACSLQAFNQADKSSQRPKRLRLVVGEIKEVSIPLPKDTTWQLTGSSENSEIVDVSEQTFTKEQVHTKKAHQMVFLIKAVTAGTAKVTFSQKRVEQEGPGNIGKTYLVEVVNK